MHAKDPQQVDNSESKAIIRDEAFSVVALLKLFSASGDVVDVANRHCWDHRVEVLQWLVLIVFVGEAFVVLHDCTKIIISISTLLLHKPYTFIEHLHRIEYFTSNVQVVSHIFERIVSQKVWYELKQVLVVLQRRILDKPHKPKRVTDLSDALSRSLKVIFFI